MTAVAARLRSASGTHPLVGLTIATLVWFALYHWLEPFWTWVFTSVLDLPVDERWVDAVYFFVYDTTKILLLLVGIIFAVRVLRSFITLERTRALLGGKREGIGNVLAACLGVITPFCSCSAVPAFIGFVAAGVPLGVTLTFLIASPLVNEVAIVLLFGLFGLGIATLYVVSGLTLAIISGIVLGRLDLERYVEPWVLESAASAPVGAAADGRLTWNERIDLGIDEVRTIIGRIWPYLLAAVAIGAAIHGWVPTDFFTSMAGPDNPLAVPAAVALGVPLYSNAAGIMPLVEALHGAGMAMGTLLAFMMSVVALSLPEMILLRRVLRPRLLATYVGVVATGIVLIGLFFNALL